MASTVSETIASAERVEQPPAPSRRVWAALRRPRVVDALVCAAYVAVAGLLTAGLWPDPHTRALAANVHDQALIEWFLGHGTLVWTGDFSLVTDRLNAPDGVNMMANASHTLHGVLFTPVTVIFGAAVSFALLVAVNLAATAAGWYLLLARTLGMHRAGAAVGAALAGFGPGMMSQSNSHLHITAQWLVPPILYGLIRLTRVTRVGAVIGTGVGLGLLIVAQAFLGEEVLFLTALTLLIFIPVYALRRRAWAREVARPFLCGSAIAAALATALLAYPLYIQFAGPQAIPNAPFSPAVFYGDVASYISVSTLSIGTSPGAEKLTTSATEANAYFGPMLLLLVVVLAVWQRRSPATTAVVGSAIVMTLLSFGPYVTFAGHRTGLPSLYYPLREMPVITGALPTRYSLALLPLFGVLLGYGIGRALAHRTPWVRFVVPAAVVAALVPILPRQVATTDREPVPTFISSGHWRECVPDGGVLVPVPLPTAAQPDAMRWAAAANARFALPEGFFIGPYGPRGNASMGTYPQPTSKLLSAVAKSGRVPVLNASVRRQAQADLRFWGADCVVVPDGPRADALRTTLDGLLFAGRRVDDVWIWDVSSS
ncbi:glycosyl transferase [Luedemannella flava]|uniref:Glycosyl transferase n=1 Tax=Luedemannella flava TaxID=349316 RepID=A0ABN2LMZ7_9ACTN